MDRGRPLARDRGQFGALYDERAARLRVGCASAEGDDAQYTSFCRRSGSRSRATFRSMRRSSRTSASCSSTSRGFAKPSPHMSSRAARTRRRCPSSRVCGASSRSAGTGGSSASAADRRRTSRASLRRRIFAAFGGSRSRRRSSAWSMRRSAERRGSTPTRARTSRARSTFRSTCSSTRRYLSTLPPEERRAGMAEVVKTGLLAGEELWSLPDGGADPRLRRVQVRGRSLRPVRARGAAGDPQPRPHVRARARGRLRLRAAARRRGRARPARGAAPLRSTDRRRRGGARTRAGAGRPRARLGRAAPRQEGQAPARAARRRRRIRDRGSRDRRAGARSTS